MLCSTYLCTYTSSQMYNPVIFEAMVCNETELLTDLFRCKIASRYAYLLTLLLLLFWFVTMTLLSLPYILLLIFAKGSQTTSPLIFVFMTPPLPLLLSHYCILQFIGLCTESPFEGTHPPSLPLRGDVVYGWSISRLKFTKGCCTIRKVLLDFYTRVWNQFRVDNKLYDSNPRPAYVQGI